MKIIEYTIILSCLVFISCSESNKKIEAEISADSFAGSKQRSENKYLAYEHHIDVDVDKARLQDTFNELMVNCLQDTQYSCTVMQSSSQDGDYARANLRFRLKAEGVKGMSELATKNGKVTSQSTSAEDLTSAVADTDKRIEMLSSYRDRLLELEKKPDNNIDSLIKISSELANTQTQLEFASGEKAALFQRIDLDILNISLSTTRESAFYSPIVDAIKEFGDSLADGIAIFINLIAYLLPWILFIVAIIFAVRKLWRRRKATS